MRIEKYGFASEIGYGFFLDPDWSPSLFHTCCGLLALSGSTGRITGEFHWEPETLGLPGSFQRVRDIVRYGKKEKETYSIGAAAFLVFDGDSGCWREYLTGLPVKTVSSSGGGSSITVNVDTPSAKERGLLVSTIRECTPTDFEEHLSVFAEEEKRQLALEILKRERDSAAWAEALEKAMQQLRDQRDARVAGLPGVKEKLASGFGQFSAAASPALKTEKKISSDDRVRWILEGRCSHCGGTFKGLFRKVCEDCGKVKDYD